VYSESDDPTYPDDQLSSYVSTTSATFDVTDPAFKSGADYNFRVCRYNNANDSCDTYSNQVSVTIP